LDADHPKTGVLIPRRSTVKTGNLTGLCPDCDRFIHRVVSLAKIELVRGKLEVEFPQGLERIRQTTSTRSHCDLKRKA
jgi:hypothetical protein